MSRIGKKPISLPAGVTATVNGNSVLVKGPKGELTHTLPNLTSVKVEDNTIVVSRANESKPARANHGLIRSLLNNAVTGVSTGFSKSLLVQGIGYRADVKGKKLVMNLGYSHLIEFDIPSDVKIEADKNNKVTVTGIDKQRVGQVAAVIRSYRTPDRYKGKGVRYEGEYIALKTGKSA